MNEIKAIWAKWRALSANLHRWIMIPTVCYLELLFHHWVGAEFTPALFLNLLGFGLCLGGILNLISAALPGRASRWFAGIAIFLCTTVMMVELLIGDAYYNFMRPALVLVSAGGVLSDYRDIMFDMIINNLGRIVIALLPLQLLLLSGRSESFLRKRCLAASLAVSLVGAGVGFSALNVSADGLDRVVAEYDFSNCLAELYGVKNFDEIQRDKNTLIMWSGCLEGKGIQIDAPVCSLDILPTLSNLFGAEYDSRMTIGRDVFGTQEAIVPWPNYSWVTELGKYDASSKKFTPFVDESLIPEGYVDRISSIVRTRISFSRGVQTCKFYTAIEDAISK